MNGNQYRLLQNAKKEALAIKRGKRVSKKTQSGFQHSKSTDMLFRDLSFLITERVARPAARAATTIVRAEAKKQVMKTGERSMDAENSVNPQGQPIGRSRSTGTFKKLGKKAQSKRWGPRRTLADAIIARNWKGRRRDAVVGSTAGPSHQVAPHAHLLEYGAVIILWGGINKDRKGGNGKVAMRLPPRPFFRTAADTTMSKQQRKVVQIAKQWAKRLGKPVDVPEIDK
jgi:hypothetical protein